MSALDISSDRVEVMGRQIVIHPSAHLSTGIQEVTMASGVVLDDPDAGTLTSNAFSGILPLAYRFTVADQQLPAMYVGRRLLRLGAVGRNGCSYMMTSPWYQCDGQDQCVLWLRPVGRRCDSQVMRMSCDDSMS